MDRYGNTGGNELANTLENFDYLNNDYADLIGIVSENLKQDDGLFETMYLICKFAVRDEEIVPWTIAFREIFPEQINKKEITKALIELCNDDSPEIALGAIMLLSTLEIFCDYQERLLNIASERSSDNFLRVRSSIYYNLLGLCLFNREFSETHKLLELIKKEPTLEKTANEIECMLNFPLKDLLIDISNGNKQSYEQFKYFVTQNNLRVSRISSMFFHIYSNSKGANKKHLLKMIKHIAENDYNDIKMADLVSQIIGNQSFYNEFSELNNHLGAEVLRPLAYRSNYASIRRYIKDAVNRNKYFTEEQALLVARGNLTGLNANTIENIIDIYKKCRTETSEELEVIPEDLPQDISDKPDALAFYIREKCDILDPPIDIYQMANKFGLCINEVESEESDEFDGCLLRGEGMFNPVIILNKNQQFEPRKRFTIAHEIAHYIIPEHHFYSGSCLTEWSWDENKKLEAEADKLAASILIPQKDIVEDAKYGIGSWHRITELGEKYNASKLAVIFRIIEFVEDPPTWIVRFDGKTCDFYRYSKGFPLWDIFPKNGDLCPELTGAYKLIVDKSIATEIEQELPLEYWVSGDIPSDFYGWTIKEHSITYGNRWVLTLLELVEPDDETLHLRNKKEKNRFGYNTFYD